MPDSIPTPSKLNIANGNVVKVAAETCAYCGQSESEKHTSECLQQNRDANYDLMLGRIFADRFSDFQRIGSGGMGVVYKARQLMLDKFVAIKVLHGENFTGDQLARFQLEAKAMSKLRHPNLVPLLDFGIVQQNRPYMVMDFIDGTPLSEIIESKKKLTQEYAVDIFIQIARAMHHAHQCGVLHRDLKPSNVLVTKPQSQEPLVYVVDFGIAKVTSPSTSEIQLTKTGDIFGSPLYMSPEQAQSKKVDGRTDIYSLGCIMFEAFTGTPPFLDQGGNSALEILMSKLNQEAPAVSTVVSHTPIAPALEDIISTALKRQPEKRFADMQALEQALVRVKQGHKWRLQYSQEHLNLKAVAIFISVLVISAGLAVGWILWDTKTASVNKLNTKEETDLLGGEPTFALMPDSAIKAVHDAIDFPAGDEIYLENMRCHDEDLKRIKKTSTVHILDLKKTEVTDKGMEYIKDLPLRSLNLKFTFVTGEGLKAVSAIRTLEALELDHNRINDKGIANLRPLSASITTLSLAALPITDASALQLSNWKSLATLCLRKCAGVHEAGLKALAALPNLNYLDISGIGLRNPHSIKILAAFPALRKLRATSLNLTDACMKDVAQLKLTDLDLGDNPITDEGLMELTAMKNLRELSLGLCPGIKSIDKFQRLMPNCVVDRPEKLNEFFGREN